VTTFRYIGVRASQAEGKDVISFAASPADILAFADIDRVGRDEKGKLKGFQRHQIASHIKEIRDYLSGEKAVLPNPIVLAFIDGVQIAQLKDGLAEVLIDVTDGKPGFVVDGQQRLSALAGIRKPGFQVFVSALVCRDYNELRQQFVLINNTRPLPKALIYELLPAVEGLPDRLSTRSFAAQLVDLLNYDETSSLHGLIYQHTNPTGIIRDTALQKLIMNSASDGAIREFLNKSDSAEKSFRLISEFFWAIRQVFKKDWEGMTPKTSRLVHGAGIVALGYVMELLYSRTAAHSREEFVRGLEVLKTRVAWTSGLWSFSSEDRRPWNGIQNTPRDIAVLASFLVRELKRELSISNSRT
jgi:DGQHR domain-containing protein